MLEVTHLRIPCMTFQRWMEEEQWVRRFADERRFGVYLRVVQAGDIAAGDAVRVRRPSHGVAATASHPSFADADAAALLASDAAGEIELSAKLRDKALRTLGAGTPVTSG